MARRQLRRYDSSVKEKAIRLVREHAIDYHRCTQ